MSQSQWPLPQGSMSSNTILANNALWEQHSVSTDCMAWTGLPNEPLTDRSMLANSGLLYSHDARLLTSGKPLDFGRPSCWNSSGMSNIATCPSADMLLSPVSPFSDSKNTFSSGSEYSPATPSDSAGYTMSPGATSDPSAAGLITPTSRPVVRQQRGSPAIQSSYGIPMASAGPLHMGNAIKQNQDVTMYASEQSYVYSQGSSPGLLPWLPPGYMVRQTAAAQGSQRQQSSTLPFDHRPNSFLTSLDCNPGQLQLQWSNTGNVPAQDHLQTRFMTPLTDVEKAKRAKDDETLLQMKQDGYTYKDIRKALGRKVAESTLRGRYRSLTKPRKDRLRAPKWTETDVR
ncbi:hypothetical protein C7974DRAFT_232457 [Boeremia exigua]|uniref:uncharacterized protein n=1 Tax=Boeremia exigua TaxID=749465 RepID=UPI001E8CF1B8|nr:uncharacterized protein C7974DRAFT_232457 [Boeremia exigua]KAH6620385.1 hypothetical protein C7974DRAFT_232457 [Boeremia exigua]